MAKIFSVKSGKVTEENVGRSREVREILSSVGKNNSTITIDFSMKTILFVLFLLAVSFLGKEILSIALFLFLGFVFMSSMRPVVLWLEGKKFSKGFAVFTAYFLLTLIILGLISLVFVPFVTQFSELLKVLPTWLENLVQFLQNFKLGNHQFNFDIVSPYIYDTLKALPTMDNVKNIAGFFSGFFSVFALLLTSIIFSVYLVLEHDSFFDILLIRIVSDPKRERVKKLVIDVEKKLGSWVLGQATVSFLVTLFAGILLSILNVPFAIPLALFVGLACLIPQFGATFGALVVALVALITTGIWSSIIFLSIFTLYQQLENTLIVPKVMSNAVGLKPILVMLGVIIFLIFFGPVGGLLAVPSMVILQILYEFYIDLQKLKAKGIV